MSKKHLVYNYPLTSTNTPPTNLQYISFPFFLSKLKRNLNGNIIYYSLATVCLWQAQAIHTTQSHCSSLSLKGLSETPSSPTHMGLNLVGITEGLTTFPIIHSLLLKCYSLVMIPHVIFLKSRI